MHVISLPNTPLTIVGFGLELSNWGFCFKTSLRRDLSGKAPLEESMSKLDLCINIDSLIELCYLFDGMLIQPFYLNYIHNEKWVLYIQVLMNDEWMIGEQMGSYYISFGCWVIL